MSTSVFQCTVVHPPSPPISHLSSPLHSSAAQGSGKWRDLQTLRSIIKTQNVRIIIESQLLLFINAMFLHIFKYNMTNQTVTQNCPYRWSVYFLQLLSPCGIANYFYHSPCLNKWMSVIIKLNNHIYFQSLSKKQKPHSSPAMNSSYSMTGMLACKLVTLKNSPQGMRTWCISGLCQWYRRPHGGNTSTQSPSFLNVFSKEAMRMYTSRRRLKPSGGFTSYRRYLSIT